MAADLRGLMQLVYDFFLQAYNDASPDAATTTVLAFEKIGRPVQPSDFKLRPDDQAFSAVLARERTTQLGNEIPKLASDFVTPTDRLVDDMYGELLLGSMPTGTQDEITFVANLKAEASKRFVNAEVESLLGLSKYHACDATPVDWYDPSKSATWPTFTKKVLPAAPEPPTPPHLIRYTPVWRLRPTPGQVSKLLMKQAVNPHTVTLGATPATPHVDPPRAAMAVRVTEATARGPNLARAALSTNTAAAVTRAAAPATNPAPSALPDSNAQIALMASRAALPMRAVLFHELLNATAEKPVSSDQLSISFCYCLVRLARQWLYQPFLDCKSWFVPGCGAGDISNGPGSQGGFQSLPLAFVAINNLSIVSNWTDQDAAAAKNSVALPPFSLVGSTFHSSTLSCPGMQIIAWICQPMPVLPPQPAPAQPIS